MGSIRPKGDRYQGRYRDVEGHEHAKNFDTLEAAESWIADGEGLGGLNVERRARMSLEAFVFTWRAMQSHLGPSSRARVANSLDSHILPALGHLALGAITPWRVHAWIAAEEEGEDGAAPATIRLHYRRLIQLLAAAEADNRLLPNQLAGIKKMVRLPALNKLPIQALTVAEVKAITEAMTPRYRIAIIVSSLTGMRLSEVLGLTLDDIPMLRKEIYVHHQIKSHESSGLWLGKVKSRASYRTIPMADRLVEALAAYLAEYPAHEQVMAVSDDDKHWRDETVRLLITTPAGAPYRPSNFCQPFGRAVAGAGVAADTTFHDLRHHYASLMLNQGRVPLPDLAAFLGHSSPSITLNIYGHPMGATEAANAAIEAAYGGF